MQKRDLRGNLLDADGNIVSNDDPDKFQKAVHLSLIHVDKGLHCVDFHFTQDNHGNGHLYGEVASAIAASMKPAARSPFLAARARALSIASRCASCISTQEGTPGMSKTNKTSLAACAILLMGVTLAELPEEDAYTHMGLATCAASQCHGSAVPREGSNVMQNE